MEINVCLNLKFIDLFYINLLKFKSYLQYLIPNKYKNRIDMKLEGINWK